MNDYIAAFATIVRDMTNDKLIDMLCANEVNTHNLIARNAPKDQQEAADATHGVLRGELLRRLNTTN